MAAGAAGRAAGVGAPLDPPRRHLHGAVAVDGGHVGVQGRGLGAVVAVHQPAALGAVFDRVDAPSRASSSASPLPAGPRRRLWVPREQDVEVGGAGGAAEQGGGQLYC